MLQEFPKKALKVMTIYLTLLKTRMNVYSLRQALGHLTVLRIDQHNISKLDPDIFVESGASDKLEKIHLTNGNIGELPIEAFQVCAKLIL